MTPALPYERRMPQRQPAQKTLASCRNDRLYRLSFLEAGVREEREKAWLTIVVRGRFEMKRFSKAGH
jgi:hypothetical protein